MFVKSLSRRYPLVASVIVATLIALTGTFSVGVGATPVVRAAAQTSNAQHAVRTPHRADKVLLSSNYNTDATPALTTFVSNTMVLAWTGTDSQHSLNISSTHNGSSFSNPFTLHDYAMNNTGPAICVFKSNLYFVWVAPSSQIMVGIYNSVTSGPGPQHGYLQSVVPVPNATSQNTPGCSDDPVMIPQDELAISWTGVGNNQVNLIFSPDGTNFGRVSTQNDLSSAGTTLAMGPIGWDNYLMVGYPGYYLGDGSFVPYFDGVQTQPCIYRDQQNYEVGLVTMGNDFYVATINTTALNIVWYTTTCANPIGSETIPAYTSNYGVSLASFGSKVYFAFAQTNTVITVATLL